MNTLKRNQIIFLLIIFAYCLYAGLFIYKTSVIIDGKRFFLLFDDAMVSMRYAENLANGYGLIWNAGGERVEGYTNFLWTVYMAIPHLFHIDKSRICLFIQITGMVILIINLFFIRKIVNLLFNNSNIVSLGSIFLTAFYLPINNWGLQGMEVSILVLIVNISVWQTLKCIKMDEFSFYPFVLLGIGTLVRPDMVVLYFAVFSFLVFYMQKNRVKNLIFGFFILILFVGIQTVFRFFYYGELFPNTYFLKMTGYPLFLRISRGLYVTLEFIHRISLLLFFLPLTILLYRRDRSILLLFYIFFAQMFYSIYVGGDAWELWMGNRYLCIVMPCFFILLCYSLAYVCNTIFKEKDKKILKNVSLTNSQLCYIILLIMASFNFVSGPKAWSELMLIKPPSHVQDNKKAMELALLLKEITNSQAKIAVVWAGIIPYFSERYCIDLLGKNDKKIARKNAKVSSGLEKFTDFWPGHMKWDYRYSIGKLKPDVIAQIWKDPEKAKYYLDMHYTQITLKNKRLYLYKDSPNIYWNKVRRFNEKSLKGKKNVAEK